MANGNKRDPLPEDEDLSYMAPPKPRSQPSGYVDPAIFYAPDEYDSLNFGTEELPDFVGQGVLDQDTAAVAGMPAQSDFFDYKGLAKSKRRGYSFESPTKKGEPGATAGRTSRKAREGGGGLSEGQLLGITGALAGGAALSQYLLAKKAGETSQDALNQQRLAELRQREAELLRRKAAGISGQSAEEDQLLEASMMNPVRALATQQMQRGEAERASMGETRAARQALESERIGRQQVTQAAQQAGLQKAQRFLQRKSAEAQELAAVQRQIDERTAYESAMQRAPLEALGNTITGVMGLAGKVLGGYIPEESSSSSKG